MKSTLNKLLSSLVLTIFLFLSQNNCAKAQFWTEDFVTANLVFDGGANGYSGVNGVWTETQLLGNTGPDANKFFISCTEAGMLPNNCGSGCPGVPQPPPTPFINQSLHLGNVPSAFAFVCPAGDCGAIYNAGDGGLGLTDAATEVRAESPTINCTGNTNIVLTFNYIEFGDGAIDNAEVWYFDGIAWSLLLDMIKTSCGDGFGGPCNPVICNGLSQGLWTLSPNIALPASADNNPNVKIGFRWVNDNDGFGTDPSFAVTRIQLISPTSMNTITTGNLVGPFCAGATATLPFTSTGIFTAGNNYTAQLSNGVGSFAIPDSLGTFPSTANIGNIALTIPANTPTGAGYLIRIVSSAPADTSATIGPFTITAALPLNVVVAANPGTAICQGDCVTFNSTVTNGGTAPTYQWQINGVNAPVPFIEDSLSSCVLQAGDTITVIVTSNLACVTNSPDTSLSSVITYLVPQTFSVTLNTIPSPLTICANDTIQLEAITVNGGLTPAYAWTINGVLVPGINTQNLVYPGSPVPFVDGTEVCVIASSSLPGCVSNSPDTVCSTISVITPVTPSVTIASNLTTICFGDTVIFTSNIINGGANPTYQWFIGANPVATAGTDSILITTSLFPGDIVSLVITSSSSCITTPTAASNTIAIDVLTFVTPTISILPSSGICPGQGVTFLSSQTFGGLNPTYTWYLNDSLLSSTSANLTVNSSIFQDNDTLLCVMYSNYACLSVDSAISNAYNVQVLDPATLDAGDDVSILYGESYNTDPEINGPVNLGFYLWSPDSTLSCNVCFDPIATPTTTTSYVLVYRNTAGCAVRDTIKIEVKPNYEVFIPSGFSPNADNLNDVFYARGPYIKAVNMRLWDRFGGLIFESPYTNYGWDGTKNYKDVNTGVYVYYITVEFLDGVIKEFKGNVTLSR
jgi:gliding motility-associated-like protein